MGMKKQQLPVAPLLHLIANPNGNRFPFSGKEKALASFRQAPREVGLEGKKEAS